MTCSKDGQRVSIAGTVTNGVTGEIIPGAQVRITKAPLAFTAELMAAVEATIAPHSRLWNSYEHLFQNRPVTADTLKTAQVILESLCRSQLFPSPRPDETLTGGDGHYCFFNLPPGDYGLTAAISMRDHRYGISYRSVQVKAAVNALVFSELDIEIALRDTQTPRAIPPIEPPALEWTREVEQEAQSGAFAAFAESLARR